MTIQKRNIRKRKKVRKRNLNRQKKTKLSKDKILEKCDDGSSLRIFKKKIKKKLP